jgi:ABC-type Fe3+-hydroxamate transport system substrate-binding protein
MAASIRVTDDLGVPVELERAARRIVSLVPSWTETLFALGVGDEVAGITKFCVEPAGRLNGIPRIGGTKNPDLRAIVKLAPDVVIANAEENRSEDLQWLRAQDVPVFVTYPRTIAGAVESMLGLGKLVAHEAEADAMARAVVHSVSKIETDVGVWARLRFRVFCPIWKNPWMSFNADTYAHDVLRMLGFNNVYAAAGERYPITTLDEALALRPDIVLLPDEPYRFSDKDVEELKPLLPPALARRVMLVSGRDLHWYGVRMIEGLESLAELLGRMRAALI